MAIPKPIINTIRNPRTGDSDFQVACSKCDWSYIMARKLIGIRNPKLSLSFVYIDHFKHAHTALIGGQLEVV